MILLDIALLITTLKLLPKFIKAMNSIAANLIRNVPTSIDCKCKVDLKRSISFQSILSKELLVVKFTPPKTLLLLISTAAADRLVKCLVER